MLRRASSRRLVVLFVVAVVALVALVALAAVVVAPFVWEFRVASAALNPERAEVGWIPPKLAVGGKI